MNSGRLEWVFNPKTIVIPPANPATRLVLQVAQHLEVPAVLNILSPATSAQSFCDRQSRRRMLQLGSLSVFGLSLPQLLKAEQSALAHPSARSKKSVILVWMHGGPSQLDMYDMKPQAPAEYRGPFRPVASSLPGLDVCELLPEHAKVMHHCSVIRSFSHGNGDHWAAAHWMLTGARVPRVQTGCRGIRRWAQWLRICWARLNRVLWPA